MLNITLIEERNFLTTSKDSSKTTKISAIGWLVLQYQSSSKDC